MTPGGAEAALNGTRFTHIHTNNTDVDLSRTKFTPLILRHGSRKREAFDVNFCPNTRHHYVHVRGMASRHARSVDLT